jgi:anaerobic magnesium-protoporphyrin IX monomethyl ester cyclase
MRITFLYPDFPTRWDPHESSYGYYSEGLASLSAVLKAAGHQTRLVHLTRHPQANQVAGDVRATHPDLLAITCRTTIFPTLLEIMPSIKRALPGIPAIIGGYHPTLDPQNVAREGSGLFDYICVGEGEGTMLELAEALNRGKRGESIRNLWVDKGKGDWQVNPVRPLIEDLDQLPLPDLALFDYSSLYDLRMNTAPVMVSRGCPYRCTYCCNHQLRQVYPNQHKYVRFRSPQRALEYIQNILRGYPQVQYINFMDNILPLKPSWVKEFMARYAQEVALPFVCRYHAKVSDPEIVRTLAKAGCYQIHFGVESGNDFLRNEILNRKVKKETIIQAFDACHQAGIATLSYNMVGLPYEDKSKFLETVKLNARLNPGRRILSVFFPYPNTRLRAIAESAGFLSPNFDFEHELYLVQPQFRHPEVIFCQRWFPFLVSWYHLLQKLPRLLGSPLAKLTDKFVVNRRIPHRALISLANAGQWLKANSKALLARLSPKLYTWLRRRLIGRRHADEKDESLKDLPTAEEKTG